jgi:hypothetical protein
MRTQRLGRSIFPKARLHTITGEAVAQVMQGHQRPPNTWLTTHIKYVFRQSPVALTIEYYAPNRVFGQSVLLT